MNRRGILRALGASLAGGTAAVVVSEHRALAVSTDAAPAPVASVELVNACASCRVVPEGSRSSLTVICGARWSALIAPPDPLRIALAIRNDGPGAVRLGQHPVHRSYVIYSADTRPRSLPEGIDLVAGQQLQVVGPIKGQLHGICIDGESARVEIESASAPDPTRCANCGSTTFAPTLYWLHR